MQANIYLFIITFISIVVAGYLIFLRWEKKWERAEQPLITASTFYKVPPPADRKD